LDHLVFLFFPGIWLALTGSGVLDNRPGLITTGIVLDCQKFLIVIAIL